MSIRPSSFFITRCLRCHYAVRSASSLTPSSTPSLTPSSTPSLTPSSTSLLPEAPMIAKLRLDLKQAMQEKNADRLDVIRGVMADVTNASKVDKPVVSDVQIFSILKRRRFASIKAIRSFANANRDDLVQKEEAQISILQKYINEADAPTDDEIASAIADVVLKLQEAGKKIHMGSVVKELLGYGGPLWGKYIEMRRVSGFVRAAISKSPE